MPPQQNCSLTSIIKNIISVVAVIPGKVKIATSVNQKKLNFRSSAEIKFNIALILLPIHTEFIKPMGM